MCTNGWHSKSTSKFNIKFELKHKLPDPKGPLSAYMSTNTIRSASRGSYVHVYCFLIAAKPDSLIQTIATYAASLYFILSHAIIVIVGYVIENNISL